MTDTVAANACLFLFTSWLSFLSLFNFVYATVKRQHIEPCKGPKSLHLSVFYTVDHHHQLRKQRPTVQGFITVQRLIFGEIVKWGLCGITAAGLHGCHMFTSVGLWVGGWVSRLGPVIRRAIYIPSSSAVGGVVIWAFLHNLFKHSGIC